MSSITKRRELLASLALAGVIGTMLPAGANPTGGTVVAGSATIKTGPSTVFVHQGSGRAIIDWQNFSIGAGETTTLKLPSASSAILNRVTSSNPSSIYGQLKSNGQVYLLNPNGILIGPNGQIQTGGFVAATLDANNAAFMGGGPLDFAGSSSAGLVNLGTIRTTSGDVALFAGHVQNAGTIAAPNGTVALGSGSQIFYAPGGADNTISIIAPPLNVAGGTAVDNSGVIVAAAAQLKAAGSPYALAINNGGMISATTVHNDGGRVLLDGGDGAVNVSGTIHADAAGGGNGGSVTVKGGDTTVAGSVTARSGASGGNGGNVELSGLTLSFSGSVDTSAAHGNVGRLLLDPLVLDSSNVPGIVTSLNSTDVTETATDSITVNTTISNPTTIHNLTLDAPAIALNAGISLPQGSLTLQNSVGLSGSSLTSTAAAPITANQIVVAGPFATTTLGGTISTPGLGGTLSIDEATPGVASFSATNTSNAIAGLTFVGEDNHFSGAIDVSNGSAMAVSGQPFAGSFALTAAGNLTMQPTTVLTSSGGNTVLASTGGAFINNAGATLVAGAGRTIIYTSTDGSGFSDGGLGYTRYNPVAFGSDPIGSGNVTYIASSVLLPTLTITANPFTRLYGGTDTFTYNLSTGTSSVLSQPVQFQIAQGSDANVGTYTIVPFGAISSAYSLTYVNATLTVNPAPLMIAAAPASRIYGSANPGFSFTVSGFVNGDSASNVSVGGTTFSTTATTASGVGTYALTPASATISSANYVPQYVNGTLTVNPAPLFVTPLNQSMVYGNIPAIQIAASYSGFVNGDTASIVQGLQLTTPVTSSSNVGTYQLIPSGVAAANYTPIYVNGTMTVTPAPLFFTVNPASMISGSPLPPFGATFTGFKNGDGPSILSGLGFSTTATSSSQPGSYPIIAEFVGATVGNYTLLTANFNDRENFLVVNAPPQPTLVITSNGTFNQSTTNTNLQAAFNVQTTSVVTSIPPGYDFLNLGGNSTALPEEQGIVNQYAAASGLTEADIIAALQDPAQHDAMLGTLLPFMYQDLANILNSDSTKWTAAQQAFVTAVENYIQQQKIAAANVAAANYQAWLTQQSIPFTTSLDDDGVAGVYLSAIASSNPGFPPPDFLDEVQTGFVVTNQQLVSMAGIQAKEAETAQQVVDAQVAGGQLLLQWFASQYYAGGLAPDIKAAFAQLGGIDKLSDSLDLSADTNPANATAASNTYSALVALLAQAKAEGGIAGSGPNAPPQLTTQAIAGQLTTDANAAGTPSNPGLNLGYLPGSIADVGLIGVAVSASTKNFVSAGELVEAMPALKTVLKAANIRSDIVAKVNQTTNVVQKTEQGVTDAEETTMSALETAGEVLSGIAKIASVAGTVAEVAGNVLQIGLGVAQYSSLAVYQSNFQTAMSAASAPVTVADLKQMLNGTQTSGPDLFTYLNTMTATGGSVPSVP